MSSKQFGGTECLPHSALAAKIGDLPLELRFTLLGKEGTPSGKWHTDINVD